MKEERTQFDYLLNALELAGSSANPSQEGYGEKRLALFAYVRDLEARAAVPAVQPADDPPRVNVLLPDGDAREVDVAFVNWTAPGELEVCITVGDQAKTVRPQEPLAWCNVALWLSGKYWPDDCFATADMTGNDGWAPVYLEAPRARQEPAGDTSAVDRITDANRHGEAWPDGAAAQPSGSEALRTIGAAGPLGDPEVMEPFWCHEQSHDRARCEAQCAECAEDEVYPVQRHITDMLVAHRDMIDAQQRGDSAAEVLAVQRMEAARAAIAGQTGVEQTEPFWSRCDAQCAECAEDGSPGPQEPDSARVPAWDRNGMVRALVQLSKALGHKPGATVDAGEGQCVEAALIELAADRLAAAGVAAPAKPRPVAFHDKDQPNGIAWCPGYPEGLKDITPLYADSGAQEPRAVTPKEDAVLRRAAMRSAKVVSSGVQPSQASSIRYDVLQEIATEFGLNYNAVCRCANTYLAATKGPDHG